MDLFQLITISKCSAKPKKNFAHEQRRECTFVHDQSGEASKTANYHRRMQCEARSCFAYEQLRECTTVHDRSSAVARHEIARNAPPPVVFLLYVS